MNEIPPTAAAICARAARVVIDTNTVIDLLHFADPSTDGLRAAIDAGRVRCFTGAECFAELARVLIRPQFRLDAAAVEGLVAAYRGFVTIVPLSDAEGAAGGVCLPRCRDRDDQKFLVAAAQCSADLLITRDKELLRLARPGRRTRLPFAVLDAAAAAGWLAALTGKETVRSAP